MNNTHKVSTAALANAAVLLLCVHCSGTSNNTPKDAVTSIDSRPAVEGDAPARDATDGDAQPSPVDAKPSDLDPTVCQVGHLTYGVSGQHFRLPLATDAAAQNLTSGLNALAAGEDSWIATSPDGQWLLMDTTRFDNECSGWRCLAVAPVNLASGATLRAAGQVVHVEGYGAIASGGQLVVYNSDGGPHARDLYATRRSGATWGAGILLTGQSTYPYNEQPALSADGTKLLFDCSPVPYGQDGSSICEVHTNGSGFRVVWTPAQVPPDQQASAAVALHHADYAPDGSIVFEGSWGGEQVWRLQGQGPPTRVAGVFGNDNSPCVLPSGCVASLWLERPGSGGAHEIKVMAADGARHAMALTGADVTDTGLGCSE